MPERGLATHTSSRRTTRPPGGPAEKYARIHKSWPWAGSRSARALTAPSTVSPLSDWEFEQYVQAEVDGEATPEQLAVLEADRVAWRSALSLLRRDAEEHLESARSLRGDEREQVIADLESELRRITAAWARHTGQPVTPPASPRSNPRAAGERPARDEREDRPNAPATVQLQVSWVPGRVVAWAAGGGERHIVAERLTAMLTAASAPSSGWNRHEAASIPGGGKADALAIPCLLYTSPSPRD